MIQEFEQFLENAYDFQEALERQKIKKEDLDALREMIKRSKLVPRYIHDKQVRRFWACLKYDVPKIFFKLLLFMNATKDNVERSSKWIHVYYKLKKNSPEFFTNRDVFSPEIQNALNNQFYVTLPVTPDGCNVIFHGLISHDPKKYVFDDVIKTFIMTAGGFTESFWLYHLVKIIWIIRSSYVPEGTKRRNYFHLWFEGKWIQTLTKADCQLSS